MSSPSPVLELDALRFAYPAGDDVLHGIDLTINKGDRVGLVGPNGAGKSTLFLLSTGILAPTSGAVRLLGNTVSKGSFNPELGLVFQNTDDQLFCPTVYEDVAFGPKSMGLDDDAITERVDQVLSDVGATKLRDRDIHQLSGGEKRIVAIAGILAMQPDMIIYDEPSVGLDMRTRRRLIGILREATATALIASHDLELLLETCNRVVVLDDGKIVADGDPTKLLGDQALMEAHGQERPHSLMTHIHTDEN